MPAKYGVNVTLSNKSLASYSINSRYPIAICGTDTKLDGLSVYSSVEKALEAASKDNKSSIYATLKDLEATGVHSQIIISAFKTTKALSAISSDEELRNGLISAIRALKKAGSIVMAKPKFLLCVGANHTDIYEALKQTAEALRAVYAFEIDADGETAALAAVRDLQYKTAIVTYQKIKAVGISEPRPASAFIVALYASVMSEDDYSFSKGFSNLVIPGITAIAPNNEVEFIQGVDCEADRLRDAGIVCVIGDDGLRAWGGNTRDEMFKFIHTYVIFYTTIETIFNAQKRAIDKRMRDVLKNVVDSLEAFYRRLEANGVFVGSRVSIPPELNTNQTIADGEINIVSDIQEMPLLVRLNNRLFRVDEFSQRLIEEL